MIMFAVEYKNHHDGIYIVNLPDYDICGNFDLYKAYSDALDFSMNKFEGDWPVSLRVVFCKCGEGPSGEELIKMLQNNKN